jgi:uncharacterized protein YbjT (DUF2867 family)
MSTKKVLVIRATGSQGKATTAHLLRSGWDVNALVRDPKDARSLAIETLGATLYKGTVSDSSSFEAAVQGCSGLFLNMFPSFTDPNAEAREAASAIEMAKGAGVNHIVHSTSLGLSDPDIKSKVAGSVVAPAMLGKLEVEKLVQESGILWTILRPSYFMTNLTMPLVAYMYPDMQQGKFITSFKPGTVLPLIDPDDIGAFAAAAFVNPKKYAENIIAVSGENITVATIIKEIERAAGKKIHVHYRTDEETAEEIKKDNPMTTGQLTTIGMDKLFDMEETKSWGVDLTSFRTFLDQNKDSIVPNSNFGIVGEKDHGAPNPVTGLK